MDLAHLTAEVDGHTTRFELTTGQKATLGRGSRCTFRIRDRSVSREHCEVELVGGRVLVRDLGSTQGILHRGVQCDELEIDVGDGFHVGRSFVHYESLATEVDQRELPTQRARAAEGDAPPAAVAPAPKPPRGVQSAELPPLAPARPEPVRVVRRTAPPAKAFAAKLTAELIVFGITAAIVVALLLVLKLAFRFDLYAAFDWIPGMQKK